MKELKDIIKTNAVIPLPRKTVINITLTNIMVKEKMLTIMKPFDLSMEQFNVLRILRGKKGEPANLQDIQDRMVSKMSNTTRLVDKLILKNLVERFTCKVNRRKVDIYITDKGLQLLKEIDPIIDSTEKEITANLTEQELQQLNVLLEKMRH
ncbi:MarR family transcriptional regulator [Lacinutrix neustonica]|uniref:MarR family transcriptional regulator n=1 Tax=Lacinutrix neustonica TaxID=2980107 RepID=A0A9E8MYK2_9FLAO|nr:MarR family transcriptional regulator [Lacinutrix neustonica]WAC03391.1 MarR family transcriptional regulator [Lacinutrix neustonica]